MVMSFLKIFTISFIIIFYSSPYATKGYMSLFVSVYNIHREPWKYKPITLCTIVLLYQSFVCSATVSENIRTNISVYNSYCTSRLCLVLLYLWTYKLITLCTIVILYQSFVFSATVSLNVWTNISVYNGHCTSRLCLVLL